MIEHRLPHCDAGTHLPYCQTCVLRKYCFRMASNTHAAWQRLVMTSAQVSTNKFQISDTRRDTAGENNCPSLLRCLFRRADYFK